MAFHQSAKRNLAIVITGGLGDALLVSPFLRYFHQEGRYDSITCYMPLGQAGLYEANTWDINVVECKPEQLPFLALPGGEADVFSPYIDVFINEGRRFQVEHPLRSNRANISIVRQVADYHHITLEDESLRSFFHPEDLCWAEEMLEGAEGSVLLNTRSQFKEKDWPSNQAVKFIEALMDEFPKLTFLEQNGLPEFKNVCRQFESMPSLSQSAALYSLIDLVVSVDSFPGHLSAAVETPAIVLFGPSNPKAFGHPENTNLRMSDCPICGNTDQRNECKDARCMGKDMLWKEVLCVARKVLHARFDPIFLGG